MRPRRRILFFGEPATLSHVVRPLVLAASLTDRFDVHFAVGNNDLSRRHSRLFEQPGLTRWSVRSQDSAAFLRRIDEGRVLFPGPLLASYVEDDLRLIDRLKPDLIVGDFRLSLGVSGPASGTPYVALTHAFWSPFSAEPGFPVPDIPLGRVFGRNLANAVFQIIRPAVFRSFARPLNRLRRRYGLAPFADWRETLCQGDVNCYMDHPAVAPARALPANHRYIGPVLWSGNDVPLPGWWKDLPDDRPIVYIALGSSGQQSVVPNILRALAPFPISIVLAGDHGPAPYPNVWSAPFLPGERVMKRSSAVICNGGTAAFSALLHGVPVLGILSNMDNFLSMRGIEARGAGLGLPASQASDSNVARLMSALLNTASFRTAARSVGELLANGRTKETFRDLVTALLREPAAPSAPMRTDATHAKAV